MLDTIASYTCFVTITYLYLNHWVLTSQDYTICINSILVLLKKLSLLQNCHKVSEIQNERVLN